MNHLVIIGHSTLDVDTILANFQPSTHLPSHSAQFLLTTKYYTASVSATVFNEQHLVDYVLNPTSPTSQSLSQSLAQATCAIVLFDINVPEGFTFIQKLYTQTIHNLLTSVDTHLFLGCTNQPIDPQTATTPLITHKLWRSWQEFSLDNHMQLIVMDRLNHKPIDYTDLVQPQPTSSSNSGAVLNNQDAASLQDFAEEGISPTDLLELDPSEYGMKAIVSAISCCSWPHMERANTKSSTPPTSASNTSTSSSSQASSQPTTSVPTRNRFAGIGLLPADHQYVFSESNLADYHAFDDDFGTDLNDLDARFAGDGSESDQGGDDDDAATAQESNPQNDNGELDVFIGADDDLAPTRTQADDKQDLPDATKKKSTAKIKKGANPASASHKSAATGPKKTGKKKRDPMASLNIFEGLMGQAAMLRNTAQSGRVNDLQRRDRATQMIFQMAKEFEMFDDMDESMMMMMMGDDDTGFGFLSNDELENLTLADLERMVQDAPPQQGDHGENTL